MHTHRNYVFLLLGSVALVAASSSETISKNCKDACGRLQTRFGSAVHHFGNDNVTYWDEKQQDTVYACRFQPASTAEVSEALKLLTETWCNFAVKGGGHSRDPNFSNSIGGVTIDLNRLSYVEIAPDAASARVGGGAISAQIYAALQPRNLTYVGGRTGSVGFGGFATGGGTSPLSGRHGWGLDNIWEYELVLPNATIITVSDSVNPDLYWALRGAGGGNFGIVTAFTVNLFPLGSISVAQHVWNETYLNRALDETYNVWTEQDTNPNVSIDAYLGYSQATDSFSLRATERYLVPVQSPAEYLVLNSIPAVSSSQQNTTLAALSGSGALSTPSRHLFQSITTFPSQALLCGAVRVFQEEIEAVKSVPGFTPFLINYPIPSAAIDRMADRGGNALGLSHVDGPLIISFLSLGWQRAEDDALIGEFADNVVARLESLARRLQVFHDFRYIGYGRAGQDIFATYGAENKARLRKIQQSVDPKGIFASTGLCNGGFKVR